MIAVLVGRRLNDRYKVLKVIGGGGMANVYLARDMILDRDVAIKVLRLDFANDESFIKRFHREAQSATSIAHPNIVSIYDVGEQEDIYYIVMEYVPGQTLKQYIQQKAPIPVEKAVDIMIQITSAIAHAHQFGIIHRDLKPQNILIDDNGMVKVTDFGIAVALSSTTITQTNSVLGSVHYLSPEQARGGLANKKSDIYSLGIVLFELLTGRVPFSGESAVSIALKHLQTETPSPKRWNPSIPQSVENVVLKATAKDSFYRYDSVEDMQTALKMSMNPERLNEKKFEVPDDEEATKAIPVITDDYIDSPTDETIVRSFSKPAAVPDEEPKPVQQAPKKKKRKKNKWLVSLLILFLVLAGAGIVAVTIVPSLLLPKDVTIPNLRDEDYEEAVTKLVSLGFVVDDPVLKADEEIAEGKVIRTVPGSGEVVKEGTEVKIYQSTGKEKVTFEDYSGQDVSTVKKMLEQKGYRFVNIVNVENEEPAGTIIDQNPTEGAENVPEETDVTFWVSKGPPSVELKDLSGWTEKSVRDYVSDYEIVVKVKKEHSDTVPQGFVMRQDPAPQTTIQKGSELTITLSEGPEPKSPKNQTVKVTIPYEPVEPGVPQEVQIYVDDLNYDYEAPADTIMLTETLQRSIELVIPYNEKAKYKIVRDNQVIEENEVPYSQQ